MRKCSYSRYSEQSEVLAHFEDRQVKPDSFKHKGVMYAVRDILKVTEVINPIFTIAGLKDRKYWIVTQDGTKALLHWHRDTGDWTVNKMLPGPAENIG